MTPEWYFATVVATVTAILALFGLAMFRLSRKDLPSPVNDSQSPSSPVSEVEESDDEPPAHVAQYVPIVIPAKGNGKIHH